jgi:putative ABC transport system permease protein
MNIWESLRVALRALGRNKMRTALTMLGIIIGVSAVITMVALGQGATQRVTSSISSMGTNLLTIMPGNSKIRPGGPGGGGGSPTLTLVEADATAIRSRCSQTVTAVAPTARGSATVKYGDKSYSTSAIGTTPEYRTVNSSPVQTGRFLSQNDVDGRLKVAVMGTSVVEQLTGDAKTNLVGETVLLNHSAYKVIGILKTKGSGSFGQDQDDQVIVPVSTALRRLFNRTYLSTINVEAASQKTMDLATEQIQRLLRDRHHILPPYEDNDDFAVRSQAELMTMLTTATGTMTSLLAGIAVVSLIVGGIGIMNIMLVSVSERTREIGLRKAVGATSKDVRLQFIIEACVISGAGGLLGVATGVAGAHVLASLFNTAAAITMASVFEAVGVATGIGLFFGIWPAQKAAQLNPIEALRYE